MPPPTFWVICLCADWCGLCKDYRLLFEDMAVRHPELRFAWVDIEDEAACVGDLDIETFPTLLLASADELRFYGPLLPHAATLERLLSSVQQADAKAQAHSPLTAALVAALPAAPRLWLKEPL